MTPWSPMASFSSTSSSSSQLLAAPHFGSHSREPSYDMWSFSRNRGPPSVVSEVPPSEIVSTVSESVFDSFSCPSSRTTTPDIPDTPSWLPSSSDACLGIASPAVRSNSDAGIESLIDELDAFVLDFSRSSTPTGDEYPRTPENEFPSSEDYMTKDRTPKAARQAPAKRRVISRTLPLTLEEAYSGGCKTKRIRGRLQAQRNDKDELELCESTIEVHYPAGAKSGLLIKVPDVGVDVKGVPQDLHFTVELVSRIMLPDNYAAYANCGLETTQNFQTGRRRTRRHRQDIIVGVVVRLEQDHSHHRRQEDQHREIRRDAALVVAVVRRLGYAPGRHGRKAIQHDRQGRRRVPRVDIAVSGQDLQAAACTQERLVAEDGEDVSGWTELNIMEQKSTKHRSSSQICVTFLVIVVLVISSAIVGNLSRKLFVTSADTSDSLAVGQCTMQVTW